MDPLRFLCSTCLVSSQIYFILSHCSVKEQLEQHVHISGNGTCDGLLRAGEKHL
jgi:hypothetical protein